jgi:STE24 endopeptidase
LAHEIGHYKKKHTLTGTLLGILQTGFTLFIFSLLLYNPALATALNVKEPNFHISLISFGILYSPVSFITGIFTGMLSRHNEFEADKFASDLTGGDDLISALKKLTTKNLSNLTPHPLYVFFHYSHPTLVQRIRAIKSL